MYTLDYILTNAGHSGQQYWLLPCNCNIEYNTTVVNITVHAWLRPAGILTAAAQQAEGGSSGHERLGVSPMTNERVPPTQEYVHIQLSQFVPGALKVLYRYIHEISCISVITFLIIHLHTWQAHGVMHCTHILDNDITAPNAVRNGIRLTSSTASLACQCPLYQMPDHFELVEHMMVALLQS